MAFLFVDSLGENNSRFVQISGKILEVLLLVMGLIFIVVVMKESVLPYSCKIVFSSLVGLWSSIRCFLSSPLSIIITINIMVLLIFASSAFYGRHDQETTSLLDVFHDHLHVQSIAHHESPPAPPQPSAPPIWDMVFEPEPPPPAPFNVAQEETPPSRTTIPATTTSTLHHDVSSTQEFVTLPSPKASSSVPQPHQIEKTVFTPPPLEKWKDVFVEEKATNHQESEEDTMEATWEAIVGGGKPKPKPKPKKEPLITKSETWDAPPPPRCLDSEEVVPTSPKWKELRKAETFNDAVSVTRRGGLVRRDPSMSLEEFNQKVDRFIKNFNDSIRLQRQQSYRRFLDITNQKRA